MAMEWLLAGCLAMIGGIYGVLRLESVENRPFTGSHKPRLVNRSGAVLPPTQTRNGACADVDGALRGTKFFPTLRTRQGNGGPRRRISVESFSGLDLQDSQAMTESLQNTEPVL